MGTRDYEELNSKKYNNSSSKLDHIANNTKYLYDWFKYLINENVGCKLNRTVFKFTKLREEIIFVKVRLKSSTDSDSAIYFTGKEFCFAVNEESFWNRFLVSSISPNGEVYNRFTTNAIKFIQLAMTNPKLVGTLRLNILPIEAEAIRIYTESSSGSDKEKINELNLVKNAKVEIIGFAHYNKRVWMYLMEKFVSNRSSDPLLFEHVPNCTIDPSLYNYTTEGALGFYDPYADGYFDYLAFYNIGKDYSKLSNGEESNTEEPDTEELSTEELIDEEESSDQNT